MDITTGINVLSLFDGMSCGMIALERAGIKVNKYYASEIDKYAIKVSDINYPDIIRLGDVTKVIAPKNIDLIIAGSPCQGFSFAGKQLNFNDPRSALFFEFVRLLDECRSYNPDVKFLLENVNMKNEYQDIISGLLMVNPVRINSELISASKRDRLYWTNICEINQPNRLSISLQSILCDGFADVEKSYCIDANYFKGGSVKNYVEKKRRQLVMKQSERRITVTTDSGSVRKLYPIECERCLTVPDNYTSSVSDSQRYKMLGNGWTVDVIAYIFSFLDPNKKPKIYQEKLF